MPKQTNPALHKAPTVGQADPVGFDQGQEAYPAEADMQMLFGELGPQVPPQLATQQLVFPNDPENVPLLQVRVSATEAQLPVKPLAQTPAVPPLRVDTKSQFEIAVVLQDLGLLMKAAPWLPVCARRRLDHICERSSADTDTALKKEDLPRANSKFESPDVDIL